jgi:HSP20 family protein
MVRIVKHEDWDARRELGRRQRESIRRARRGAQRTGKRGARVFPSIIISATDEKLIVRAEVPGIKLKDLDISVSGDSLTIRGVRVTGAGLEGGWYHRRERERGSFSRAIGLPAAVDGDRAEATYVAGVLTVGLPVKEAAKPKEITVKVVEG